MADELSHQPEDTSVRGATSAPFPVSAGVPQGSILGPTLFLVYANDAADVLPEGVTPATYADDTTLYCIIRSSATAESQCLAFQTGVDNLATRGAKWRVQFEPAKSQALTITRHRIPWQIAPVQFSGLAVEEVGVLKLLGVTFDKHLFYGPHLQRIALRAAQRIGFLRKSFKVQDTPGRLAAYKGFVRPMLEYCPLVWAGAAPYHLSLLDKIQKRALSLIGPGVSVDSLALRRSVSSLCLLHKLMSGPRLPTLANLLPPTESASYGAKNATPTRRDAPFPTLGYPSEKVQRHHFEIISVRTDCSMEFPPNLRRESGTCIKGPARLQNTGV